MQICYVNLPQPIRDSISEDLETVMHLAPGRDVQRVPEVQLHIVSLERGNIPQNIPSHKIKTPAPEIPVSFAKRCDWETERQSFQVIERPEGVWVIGGGTAGALYGFGEVLACLTGVIWAGPRDEEVLFGAKRSLPTSVQSPRIPFRSGGWAPAVESSAAARWMGRNRWNVDRYVGNDWGKWSPEKRKAVIEALRSRCIYLRVGEHSQDLFLPQEEFNRHPEWFGMREGKRVIKAKVSLPECPNLEPELPINPCYSNPEAREYITDRMAEFAREHPEIDILSVWPYDGVNNWCQCPECLKKLPSEHMYNLAMQLESKLPKKVVMELIAYSNMLKPPHGALQHSDRTFTMLCPYLRHFRHRVFDPGGPEEPVTGCLYPEPDRINPVDEREYGKLLKTWKEVWDQCGSVPAVSEYAGFYYDETRRVDRPRYLYHPPADLRCEEVAWYAEQGVRVFYLYNNGIFWPDHFHQFAISRFVWDHTVPVETVERDYYTALAGENGMALRKALKSVAMRLLAEENPEVELQQLEVFLSSLADVPYVRRYRLWAGYVTLGRKAREYELSGQYDKGAQQEQRVQEYLAANTGVLDGYISIEVLIKRSELAERRFRERITGETAGNYSM